MYKEHPFILAMETVVPIFLPSFSVRSGRNKPNSIKYPVFDYVIIRGLNKVYDNSTRKFRNTFEVQLGLLLQENKENFWCEYDELKHAKDRDALFYELEKQIEHIIKAIVDPKTAFNGLRYDDIVYSKYDFQFVSYLGTQPVEKQTKDFFTGVYSVFTLSYLSDEQEYCCSFDDTLKGLQNAQRLVEENSISWQKIQNQIDKL